MTSRSGTLPIRWRALKPNEAHSSVVEWAWVWRLRRESVIDVHDHRRHMARRYRQNSSCRFRSPRNPSSAVHIDDHDTRLAAVIDPYRNVEGGVLVYLPNRNWVVRQDCRATYAVQVLLPTAWILQVFDGRERVARCWTVQRTHELGDDTNSPHLYSIVRDRITGNLVSRRIQRQVPTMTAPASNQRHRIDKDVLRATARSRTTRPSRVGLRKACVPPKDDRIRRPRSRRRAPTSRPAGFGPCSSDVTADP